MCKQPAILSVNFADGMLVRVSLFHQPRRDQLSINDSTASSAGLLRTRSPNSDEDHGATLHSPDRADELFIKPASHGSHVTAFENENRERGKEANSR
jgi:hypothetical protein